MYKIGDRVRIIKDDNGSREHIGKIETVTAVSTDDHYPYTLASDDNHWADYELELVKEESVAEKYYKVIKDTPAWKKGAILKQDADGDYRAINDLWDAIEDLGSYHETGRVVEHSSFYERVYAMGKAQKMLFVSREKAQEMASKFFTGE
jgi:hypothetical protein